MARKKRKKSSGHRKNPKRVAAGKKAARTRARKRRSPSRGRAGTKRATRTGLKAARNRVASIRQSGRKKVNKVLSAAKTAVAVKKANAEAKLARKRVSEALRAARSEARRIRHGQHGPAARPML